MAAAQAQTLPSGKRVCLVAAAVLAPAVGVSRRVVAAPVDAVVAVVAVVYQQLGPALAAQAVAAPSLSSTKEHT